MRKIEPTRDMPDIEARSTTVPAHKHHSEQDTEKGLSSRMQLKDYSMLFNPYTIHVTFALDASKNIDGHGSRMHPFAFFLSPQSTS